MDRDTIIDGLRMTMDLCVFDPSTGEEIDPDMLNDINRATYDACKGALEILERLDTDSDTISRQAAIDAVEKESQVDGAYGYMDTKSIADLLNALPSAQPEQHTCVNCGRTVNNGGWYADGRTRCPIEEHYALPKDGYCHLWEERNVTDDDYPERREE
jgi:hypothetical protein